MRWMTFAVLLVLAQPGKSVAGPPEKISGKLVFDEVADGLRKYRKEKDEKKRVKWLEKLAPTRDPRVAVAIGEGLDDSSSCICDSAFSMLWSHYAYPGTREPWHQNEFEYWTRRWWKEHEADLRRRAKQLPQ